MKYNINENNIEILLKKKIYERAMQVTKIALIVVIKYYQKYLI